MKLPISLPFQKTDKSEYFLALLLRDEKATAVIFSEQRGKVRVVGKHEAIFQESIEDSSEEAWLDAIDKAISTAEESLPKDIQTHKTIFGVKTDWVDDAKIKPEYLAKLKKVSDELALSPIGFLVITEAIAHLLAQEEGAPVSAILLEVGKRGLTASLLRSGRVIEAKSATIDDTVVIAADKLLHEFSSYEVLPSRLIVFNGKANEALAQEFTSHSWSRSIPFLHVPTVVPLPKEFDAQAVLFGAAMQMGFDVLEPLPHIPTGKAIETDEPPLAKAPSKKIEGETKEPDFGFVMEQDIAETGRPAAKAALKEEMATEATHEKEELEEKEEEEKEDGENALDARLAVAHSEPRFQRAERVGRQEEDEGEEEEQDDRDVPTKRRSLSLPSVGAFLPHLSLPSFGGNKKLVFIPPLLLILLIVLFGLYIFLLKATVVLHITPREVTKEQEVTFSADAPTDVTAHVIAARSVKVSVDGTLSTSVTGKKETGDKAKGSVTLFSRLPERKTIPAGTQITGPSNLVFTLDKEASLASSSADASSSPSTATVPVTAADIGKESNLPSGSKFSVKGYDTADLVAKNDSAFAGGTKKQISVVAQADLDKLVSELPKNLEEKAKDTGSSQVASDEAILPILVNTIVDKKEFDKKLGQEATSVTLKATVTFEEMSYKKDAVDSYSKELLKDDLADGELAKNGITYTVTDAARKSDGEVTSHLKLTARLVPKIDSAKIGQSIAGKSFDEARNALTRMPQVASAEIALSPSLPILPALLPRLSKNITVTVGQ